MALRTGVIYLQKDKLQIYSPTAGNVLEMRFTPTMIRDLDVLSIEELEIAIKNFVTNGKIAPCALVIVLSDTTYFVKDFVSPAASKTPASAPSAEVTKELLLNQAEQFVEHVPFDNVVSKSIPLKNGLRVCATNKDFYEAIAVAFEHHGFSLVSILPGLVVGAGFGARPVLDAGMATTVLTKVSTLKEYDLLNQQVYQSTVNHENEEVDEVALEKLQKKKASRKQLYLVGGIFAVVLVLVVVLVMQFITPPPKQAATTTPPPPAPPVATVQPTVAATTPTVTIAISASSSAGEASTTSIQIASTPDAAATAQTLRQNLLLNKFKSVTTQTQSALGSSSTVISFPSDTSQSIRDIVLEAVREVKTNVTVQDKSDAVSISIILGE